MRLVLRRVAAPPPLQPGKSNCPAPLLSIIKNPSMSDVLVPPFGRKYEPIFEPWSLKSDHAFFRHAGGPWWPGWPAGRREGRAAERCGAHALYEAVSTRARDNGQLPHPRPPAVQHLQGHALVLGAPDRRHRDAAGVQLLAGEPVHPVRAAPRPAECQH